MYVFEYKDGMPPAALFSLTTLAVSSPTLLYLLCRALKPRRTLHDQRGSGTSIFIGEENE